MTEYVVTYVSEEGQRALSLAVALGNDEQARQFASRTAQRAHGVTLETVDLDGMTAVMARWLDGALMRANGNSPQVIEGEFEEAEVEESEAWQRWAEQRENGNADDDEAHHFEGRCMKCKVNREFIGRVTELSNGSKAAKGNCPVCGTAITRMVARSTPLDDDWDDDASPDAHEHDGEPVADDENPDDNPDAGLDDLTEQVEEAIADVAEGEPIAEVAETTAAIAVEFSNAAEEVEQQAKPTPRKRAAKKATASSNGKTANQIAAANPVKRHCAKCDTDVDTIERAGIQIFTVHPDPAKGLDRCPGSTTVVQG